MTRVQRGTIFQDRYEVVDRIGKGGMGVVYQARQLGLERMVAIKMLLPDLALREEDRVRFQREARVMSRLRHDNAVQVYDYGEWEGRLYLVMELLTGTPLRSRMTDGEPYGVDDSLAIGWQVADVLTASHELSLVHRDIKPENIMIETRADGTERVVVVDFGLAFMQEAGPDLARLTANGLVSGTPQYMPPEQARGASDLGPAADVYALGGMMFELLTGDPPFAAKKMIDLVNQHLFVPAPSMRERAPELNIGHALDDLVMRMLEKAAADRPTAEEVRERLGLLITGETSRGRGRPEALNEPRSRRIATGRLNGAPGNAEGFADTDALPARQDILFSVAVTGELSTDRHVALRASGIAPVPWASRAAADVVFALAGSDLSGILDADLPVVAEVADDVSMNAITELMRSGVTDVVRTTDDDARLIRKLTRAVRSHRRGKE